MSSLSTFTTLVVVFCPLVATFFSIAGILWIAARSKWTDADGPELLLRLAVPYVPDHRQDWAAAMLAELRCIQGGMARWHFAAGCARAALFSPKQTATRHFGPLCGIMSVTLPPLGLPLLYLASIAANHFTTQDDFFNGELVPGAVGVFIVGSLVCMLSGLPLGFAGLIRREQARWLSLMGQVSSICIFSYLMIVQYLASANLR